MFTDKYDSVFPALAPNIFVTIISATSAKIAWQNGNGRRSSKIFSYGLKYQIWIAVLILIKAHIAGITTHVIT